MILSVRLTLAGPASGLDGGPLPRFAQVGALGSFRWAQFWSWLWPGLSSPDPCRALALAWPGGVMVHSNWVFCLTKIVKIVSAWRFFVGGGTFGLKVMVLNTLHGPPPLDSPELMFVMLWEISISDVSDG